MNWKKILIKTLGTAAVVGLAALAGVYASALLIAKADILTWAAEAGIALLGCWGVKQVWKSSPKLAKQPSEVGLVPTCTANNTKQKENQHERGNLQIERPKKRLGIRAPKLIAKWRARRAQQKENYRDAA